LFFTAHSFDTLIAIFANALPFRDIRRFAHSIYTKLARGVFRMA
jgi:hypothetical protein